MKVDVELEPFTPLLRPTYADAHAGAISEVRMEGYEFGHTYVWQGPGPPDPPGHLEPEFSGLNLHYVPLPRTVNGTGHTGPSEFCATSI